VGRLVEPIGANAHGVLRGFLEFSLRYDPSHAGGWSRRTFIKAARAEGVPIAEERYACIGDHGRMLHESAVFTSLDLAALGGCLGPQREGLVERPRLPVSDRHAGGGAQRAPPSTRRPP